MHARTSSWTGTPEALEAWERHVAAHVAPMVAQLPGNAGAYFFIDRERGRGMTLTLWETAEAARATDATAERSRKATTEATGVELVERGAFELVGRR